MRALYDTIGAPALLVLLPGALQQPEQLLEQGYAGAVRERGLALDIALLDPGLRTINEATDGSAAQRLDAVLQAARRDYATIWLAGISLGGFMALAHAARYPGRVQGLCLLSPYPGNRLLTGAIATAGGPAAWAAHSGQDGDDEERVWRWLARNGQAGGAPEIHFGFAAQDRFAAGQRLMAATLPPARVELIEGDHDWPSWRILWNGFLDRNAGRFGVQP